jgi:peroxiredoxin Q/BCP
MEAKLMNSSKYVLSLLFAFVLLLGFVPASAQTVGESAPDFDLPDQYGDRYALEDFSGRWLVLYFYPRADTPGCTTEACNFRDNIYAIRGAGAEVVGISVDTVEDQRAFSDKYKLPFPVLSDIGGEASSAYGVLREMGSMDFAGRETFLIDPNGVVVKHYKRVDPETHTQDVVADLETFREEYSPAG